VEIKVTARHGSLSESTQEAMKAKVAKLPRFFDRTTGIQILVDLEHTDTPKVEIIVSAEETNDFFASDTGSNVIVALDSTISKIEQQLKKHKEKLIGNRNRDHKLSGGRHNRCYLPGLISRVSFFCLVKLTLLNLVVMDLELLDDSDSRIRSQNKQRNFHEIC